MPTPPPQPAPARSAAAVNEDIRALWARAGGSLTEAERETYRLLLTEYAAAARGEVAPAA